MPIGVIDFAEDAARLSLARMAAALSPARRQDTRSPKFSRAASGATLTRLRVMRRMTVSMISVVMGGSSTRMSAAVTIDSGR